MEDMGSVKRGAAKWGRRAVAATVLMAAAFFILRGCAFMPWNERKADVRVRVTVSRGFGAEVMKDERFGVREGESAMRALERVAEVETAYGGGFIQAVNGLASRYEGGAGSKVDWFFYVNGQMADTGAGAYTVREGDWLIFDFHSWDYAMFTPLLAGCFPEPFVHGYGGAPPGVVVAHAAGREGEAAEIAGLLERAGAAPCRSVPLTRDWMPEPGEYAVVVGTFEELEVNAAIREANLNPSRTGLFAYFREGELWLTDASGEVMRHLAGGAGLVEALGPRLGDGRTSLMVTGTDGDGLREALALLARNLEGDAPPVPALAALAGEGPLDVPQGR